MDWRESLILIGTALVLVAASTGVFWLLTLMHLIE
jgi:hypothetical protein